VNFLRNAREILEKVSRKSGESLEVSRGSLENFWRLSQEILENISRISRVNSRKSRDIIRRLEPHTKGFAGDSMTSYSGMLNSRPSVR
jgi:hypothetical protein